MPKTQKKNQVSDIREETKKTKVDDEEEKEGGEDMASENKEPKRERSGQKGKHKIRKPRKKKDEEKEVDDIVKDKGSVDNALLFVVSESKYSEQKDKHKIQNSRKEIDEKKEVDDLVECKGSVDDALLFVVSESNKQKDKHKIQNPRKEIDEKKEVDDIESEKKVNWLVCKLIHRGANPSLANKEGINLLHLSVNRNLPVVCRTLLRNNADPLKKDNHGRLPCSYAIEKKSDSIAALLIKKMPKKSVRKQFPFKVQHEGEKESILGLKYLLDNDMQETALAVLDCCKKQIGPDLKVYYAILEADEDDKLPTDQGFKRDSKSPLYLIAEKGNKTLINHDVVRLLVRKKWNADAGTKFKIRACIYLLSVFALTFSAVVAVSSEHPLVYNTTINICRAIAEIFICLVVFHTLINELYQFKRHKMNYLKSGFNIIDMCSVLLLLAVIPCRFMQLKEQWPILSVAYLLWTLKMFKFAIIFRQTGAYAQMLWTILTNDILQFTAFFLVILLAFGGAFFLSMKGEDSTGESSDTSSFWNIVFLGLRILIESDRIIEYTEFRPMSCILMLMFLFTCCVILLNILIAQLSDTYQNVQQDAWRGLEINWAWIVVSGEINSMYSSWCNKSKEYKGTEKIKDFKKVLGEWDAPKTNHMQDLHDSIDLQKENIWKLNDKVAEQEEIMKEIRLNLYEALAAVYEMNDREEEKEKKNREEKKSSSVVPVKALDYNQKDSI